MDKKRYWLCPEDTEEEEFTLRATDTLDDLLDYMAAENVDAGDVKIIYGCLFMPDEWQPRLTQIKEGKHKDDEAKWAAHKENQDRLDYERLKKKFEGADHQGLTE